MGGPLQSPGIGGAHFRPPLSALPVQQQPPPSGPQSHFFASAVASQDPVARSSEAVFGSDATTHEDMQLDDEDSEDQESGGVQGNDGSSLLDVKQQGSDAMQEEERFRVPKHRDSEEPERVGFEDSEHLESGHPEHGKFDSQDGNSVEPQSNECSKSDTELESKKLRASSHEDSPVLSPDDFQMSDNEERNAHSDSRHHVSLGDEGSERPPQS